MISLAEVSSIADREARDGGGTDEIIGASLALRGVLRDVDVYSPRPIRRSSSRVRWGTGKELVARAIHDRSARRGQSFVSISGRASDEEERRGRAAGAIELLRKPIAAATLLQALRKVFARGDVDHEYDE